MSYISFRLIRGVLGKNDRRNSRRYAPTKGEEREREEGEEKEEREEIEQIEEREERE